MLNLNSERRSELLKRSALTEDEDGDEVLVGLTLAETLFYIAFEQQKPETRVTGETALYYQLKLKHLSARGAALRPPIPSPHAP